MLNLKISVIHQFRADPFVTIDKVRIQQIIINLVQNSVKYSRHGGTIQIEVGLDQSSDGTDGLQTYNIHVID
jgi:signal transduction histidine kinase